jgi:Sec-independent protein secretion pathway component TatC
LAILFFAGSFLVLIAVPAPHKPGGFVAFSGGYVPLVAVVLSEMRSSLLPTGWSLLGFGPGEAAAELYLASAAQLALIFDFPLIGYMLIRPIAPAPPKRRTLVAGGLTVIASVLFAAGTLIGCFVLTPYLLIVESQAYVNGITLPPLISALDFYRFVFQSMLMGGVILATPVCLYECTAQARMHYARQSQPSVDVSDVRNFDSLKF